MSNGPGVFAVREMFTCTLSSDRTLQISQRVMRSSTFWLLGLTMSTSLVLRASEVPISLNLRSIQPANVTAYVGDTVSWSVPQGSTAIVEAFGGQFRSPLLSSNSPSFSYNVTNVGFIAFLADTKERGAGLIYVLPVPPNPATVAVYSPLSGARFRTFLDPDGTVASPAFLDLFATVSNTNEVRRVEFSANGEVIGASTNWPFYLYWQTKQSGTIAITATAIDTFENRVTSEPVTVSVEGVAGISPTLVWNRFIGDGFIVLEYMTGPGAPWFLQIQSDVVPPSQTGSYTWYKTYLRSSWGLFPMETRAPREFIVINRDF